MFCPKCGTKNPENGKFCRTCGTDLSPVSKALSGKSQGGTGGFGMIEPIQPAELIDINKKGMNVTWESAMGTFFGGLAFLIVSIILAVTGAANSSKWWFWLLIPAFAMIGTGVAQIIQLKKIEQGLFPPNAAPARQPADAEAANTNFVSSPPAPGAAALPPTQTEYISPQQPAGAEARYKTGDLVPPSVTEETTRHLEINQEGETMTLPKK